MMINFFKSHFQLTAVILFSFFLIHPILFSQDLKDKNTIPDSIIKKLTIDFLEAVNSGNREEMKSFILNNYDETTLKRIPLSALISFNLGLYYETGGLGYEPLKTLKTENNILSFILNNKLTKTDLKFQIPVTDIPPYKISWLVKSEPVKDSLKQNKVFADDEIVNSLEIVLTKMEEEEEFSGSVILAKEGEILFKKAVGEASKSYNIPNKIDTKFNIASVGKIFTALAVLQLAEQGKLSFDDYINKYVPADWLDPSVSSKIQIRHLLTHTSGLGDYFSDAYKQCAVPFFRVLNDYKALIADDTLSSEPGTRFSYSNTGFILLGVIIEKVSGEEYLHYLKKNIFVPSGMNNTDGFYRDREVENRATGYSKIYENGKPVWDNHQFTRILGSSPSGGIYSTAEDMLKFDNALRAGKLLSDEYSKLLFEGRPELNVSFHSYGFFLSDGKGGRVASHQGDGRGVNCQFKMFLDTGHTVIVLSNYSVPSANIIANVLDQLISY